MPKCAMFRAAIMRGRAVQGWCDVACVTTGCGVPHNGVFVTPFVVSIGIAGGGVAA